MPGDGWTARFGAVGMVMLLGLGVMGCPSRRVLFEDRFDTPGTLQRNWILRDTPVEAREGPSRWDVAGGRLYQRSNIYRGGAEAYAYYEGTRLLTRSGNDWTDVDIDVTLHPIDDDGAGIPPSLL